MLKHLVVLAALGLAAPAFAQAPNGRAMPNAGWPLMSAPQQTAAPANQPAQSANTAAPGANRAPGNPAGQQAMPTAQSQTQAPMQGAAGTATNWACPTGQNFQVVKAGPTSITINCGP